LYESFVLFLDDKLSPIMTTIWNENPYLNTISEDRYDSLSFLYDPSSISLSTSTSTSSPIEDILIELSDRFDEYPIRFFKMNYQMPEVGEVILIHGFGLTNEMNRFGHGRLLSVRAVKAIAPREDLGQRTEQNMLDKVSEGVSGMPQDEVKSAFLH
jgi:hypothetical protein